MADRPSLKDMLDQIDEEVDEEAYQLWGSTGLGNPAPGTELFESPKFKELVFLLLAEPILVTPTLNFCKLKQAQIARAKLEILYTPEELEALYADLEKQSQ